MNAAAPPQDFLRFGLTRGPFERDQSKVPISLPQCPSAASPAHELPPNSCATWFFNMRFVRWCFPSSREDVLAITRRRPVQLEGG